MISVLLLAVAAAVAFWPAAPQGSRMLSPKPADPQKPTIVRPEFRPAIDALAYVRGRLLATDLLDEQAKSAIDTLTLSLVAGSDKP